jgi:hypothetical protein
MTLCNNAFIDLSNRLEDIMSSSFEESPRGDKNRVLKVGDNIIKLLANSYYSLTWLNAKFVSEAYPENKIDPKNIKQVEQASQAQLLKFYFNQAIDSFERWAVSQKF